MASTTITSETFKPTEFEVALRALPKKELLRLMSLFGITTRTTRDRERFLLASRLARVVDNVTITVGYDTSRLQQD